MELDTKRVLTKTWWTSLCRIVSHHRSTMRFGSNQSSYGRIDMRSSTVWLAGAILAVTGLAASGCSEGRLCGDEMPESVLVDASTYATSDLEVEVCIYPLGDPRNTACSAPGYAWTSVTWHHDQYPEEVGYSVATTDEAGVQQILISGSYRLQCQPGTVRIELGSRPTPETTEKE